MQQNIQSTTGGMKKDVESHSSALTNMLIADIKKTVVRLGFEAMTTAPNPYTRINYFSAVLEYFLETKDIYEEDDLKLISDKIKRGNIIASRIRVRSAATPANIENLLQISISLQYMINTTLQKKGYFFRLGKRDFKGLDSALEMFGENKWEEKEE